jgi:hypothetical protein
MEKKTYSIGVRLRRTKVEYAVVSVPLDSEAMEEDPGDATQFRVNTKKVFEFAKRLGADASVVWVQEGKPSIKIHPWQTAPPRA